MRTIPEISRMTGRSGTKNLSRNVIPGTRYRVFFLLIICLLLISLCSASLYGTETIITTDSVASAQTSPAMYGDWIVWADARDYTIHLYNLTNGEEAVIPSALTNPKSPSIFGDTIVWQGDDGIGNYQIIIYNTSTANADSLVISVDPLGEDNSYPKIYRDEVVWQNYTFISSTWDVYLYNITTGLPAIPITDIANGIWEKSPAIFDNFIVYENWSDPSGFPDVWLYNVSNSTAVQISNIEGSEKSPDIYGSRIVWAGPDQSDPSKSRIYLYDAGTVIPISPPSDPNIVGNPSIYGDQVVYNDYRGTSGTCVEIYMYDIPSETEYQLVPRTGAFDLKLPKIHGNRIVWEDGRSGVSCAGCDSDIYLLTLGSVETCPVADFTPKNSVGASPFDVQFANASSPGTSGISRWFWNFSDGSVFDTIPNPLHHFTTGVYPVKLTVGNTKCRNTTPDVCAYRVYSGSPPLPDFTANVTAGFAPLTVVFTDRSCGKPTGWQWNFDDGQSSTQQNPTHVYTQSGTTFDVSLTADNGYGPNTTVYNNLVRTFLGTTGTSKTTIDGIAVDHRFGPEITSLTVDTTRVPDFSPVVPTHSATLTLYPPVVYGWQNLTFTASDTLGFSLSGTAIEGNFSTSTLWTSDVTVPDNSPTLRSGWGANYRLTQTAFPIPASIRTEIWESTLRADEDDAGSVARSISRTLRGTAFTANITKINLTADGNAVINMSIDSAALWLESNPSDVRIIGVGWLPTGDRVGAILQTDHTTVSGAEYFSGAAPNYLTKFILAKVSGSGNVFQMVYLGVVQHFVDIQSSSDSSSYDFVAGTAKGTGQGLTSKQDQQAAPAPEAKSVDLFINEQAVVTQTTILQSPDQLATLSIGQGVVAKDSDENPLSSVTIASASMSASGIPESLQGSTFSFAGIAYNLQPDGATFSPAATITFTVPQAQWSQHYMVKEWDPLAQVWVDLPTTYHPESGTISASVSNFCIIALFSDTITPSPTPPQITVQTPLPTIAPPQPTSPFGVFYGMVAWLADMIMKNLYLFLIVAAIAVAFYINRRRKGRDPLRFK